MERPSHKRARPNAPTLQADFIDIRAIRVGPVGDAAGQGTITRYRTISGEEYVRKTLQDPLNPRAVARMRKEIEALQELKHDHIIQLSSYDVSKGGVSYVTRYYPLGSLHAFLEENEVSTVDAVLFMRQLLDALGAAHDAGIIHRDIKPQNILMRDDMHVLLADFGLVYRADGHSTAPGAGTRLHCPRVAHQWRQAHAHQRHLEPRHGLLEFVEYDCGPAQAARGAHRAPHSAHVGNQPEG